MKRLIVLAFLAACLWAQRDAKSLLQSAIKKEAVDGNLAGAMEDYKKAVTAAKSDRATAARALFGLAQCYRRLGDAQAKATLERLVREFGDQPVAMQARTQLAALTTAPVAPGVRLQKLFPGGEYSCSSVSRDGKLLGCAMGHVDEAMVYEVDSGKTRVLTAIRKETPANRFINTYRISPDGKWMALHIYRAGAVFSELALAPTEGKGGLRTIYKHPDGRWLDILAWTPDSKDILFSVSGAKRGDPYLLMTVDADSGATKLLREHLQSMQHVFTPYSPDGKWLAFGTEICTAAAQSCSPVGPAGAGGNLVGWSADAKSLLIGTSREGKGALLQFPVSAGKVTGPPQTIPMPVEGRFSSIGMDASGILYFTGFRSESDIYAAPFDPQTGFLTGKEKLLSQRALHKQAFGSWSPDGSRFASWTFDSFINNQITRPQVVVRAMASGTETIAAADRPIRAMQVPSWDAEGKALLLVAPDGGSPENRIFRLFRMDPASGKMNPASIRFSLPNPTYAPAWSSDGRFLYSRNDTRDLVRIDLVSGEEKVIYSNPPGEGAIRNPAISPDGPRLAFFANSRAMKPGGEWTATTHRWIHVLNLSSESVKNIEIAVSGSYGGNSIAWSPDGRYIVFASEEKGKPSIWVAPSDGSAPARPLSLALDGNAGHLAFSADGRTLTYTLSVLQWDMWTMSNFLGGAR